MLKGRIMIERIVICLIGLSVTLTQIMPACAAESSGGAASVRTKESRPGLFLPDGGREQAETIVRISYNKKEMKEIKKDQKAVVKELKQEDFSGLEPGEMDDVMENVMEDCYDNASQIMEEKTAEQTAEFAAKPVRSAVKPANPAVGTAKAAVKSVGSTSKTAKAAKSGLIPKTAKAAKSGLIPKTAKDTRETDGAGNIVSVDSNMKPATYNIDGNVRVTFDEEKIALDILETGREESAGAPRGFLSRLTAAFAEPCFAAGGDKTRTASHRTRIYDSWTKKKCFECFVEARFTYNKKRRRCTVETLSHYAKKFSIFTLFSTVHDRKYTVDDDSRKSRTCRQEGYIRTGIKVGGQLVELSDYYACAALSCNYKGKITRKSRTA
ncbi:hypothetical protein [Hornefia butyriciproducens]|uniref:hypothetical protein n=1 Tax=Hornefia butyriciproducens TaxID=2652293 RepID=UPI002A90BEBF|nr:hypothetical protein [Hornefia butyriciproducens]MDY5422806.1 hypothetical protein [Hornefia butyriciproducens]